MRYRHVGASGLIVSELSFGNWITHGSQVDDERAKACVAAALDAGINSFDTADVYAGTRAEQVLGEALKGERRESYVLATKAYYPTGPGPNDRGLSRKHIMDAAHGSLRRLGTDHVDIFYLHRFDVATPLIESLRAADDLIRQGKARYVGVSEWTGPQIRDAVQLADAHGLDRIVVNQPQYSLLWRVIEAEVMPACAEAGIGQIVWSPLAQGVLTGKYRPGDAAPAGSRATDERGAGFIGPFLREPVLHGVQKVAALAAEAGLTPAQLAIAWTLRTPAVSSAILGASQPAQLAETVAASGVTLDDELVRRVEDILEPVAERDPSLTDTPTGRP